MCSTYRKRLLRQPNLVAGRHRYDWQINIHAVQTHCDAAQRGSVTIPIISTAARSVYSSGRHYQTSEMEAPNRRRQNAATLLPCRVLVLKRIGSYACIASDLTLPPAPGPALTRYLPTVSSLSLGHLIQWEGGDLVTPSVAAAKHWSELDSEHGTKPLVHASE